MIFCLNVIYTRPVLSDHFFKNSQLPFERRIFQGRIEPGGGSQDGFSMRKNIKTVFTMICPDPAVSSSAKRKVMIGQMPACIVDASTAERYFLYPGFSLSRRFRKN